MLRHSVYNGLERWQLIYTLYFSILLCQRVNETVPLSLQNPINLSTCITGRPVQQRDGVVP